MQIPHIFRFVFFFHNHGLVVENETGEYQSICSELMCSAIEAELEALTWFWDSVMMFSSVENTKWERGWYYSLEVLKSSWRQQEEGLSWSPAVWVADGSLSCRSAESKLCAEGGDIAAGLTEEFRCFFFKPFTNDARGKWPSHFVQSVETVRRPCHMLSQSKTT